MSHRFKERPHVDDPDLVDRMRLVEGEKFCQDGVLEDVNAACNNSPSTAQESYAKWKKRWAAEEDREYAREQLSSKASTSIVIYGTGGWDRYYVRGDGSVVFSERHGRPNVEKAREAGFEIFR